MVIVLLLLLAAGILSTAIMSRTLSYIERTEKAVREGSEKG